MDYKSRTLDPNQFRLGSVSPRYFRENSAQAGLDLVQILPELITNADAAIGAAGRSLGQIRVVFGDADESFAKAWKREIRRLNLPARNAWTHELRCIDNGVGVTPQIVDERLSQLGATPDSRGQRGLFGRGLREVWLAQGGGRIVGVRGSRVLESWFFPAENGPFAFQTVRDCAIDDEEREELGIPGDGTCVFVPLSDRPPSPGRLRRMLADHVQLRPILEDPARDLWLSVEDSRERVLYEPPEPDPDRPILLDTEVDLGHGVGARVVVRRARTPFAPNVARALRRGGLLVRSGRAAHEATLTRFENRPGAQFLYGEVRCDAIEDVQRRALVAVQPQVVVRPDRGGLSEHHPLVRRLHAKLGELLEPIVADEERRAGVARIDVAQATRNRDQEGLRTINRVLKQLFREDGAASALPGDQSADDPPAVGDELTLLDEPAREDQPPPSKDQPSVLDRPIMYFKRSPVRLHPSETRDVTLIVDAGSIPPSTEIELDTDGAIGARIIRSRKAQRIRGGRWTVPVRVRARANSRPGTRPLVTARVGDITALLDVVIVSHHASGWVTEIVREDKTAAIEAGFDPETGIVTVYEGRPEFRKLESAARAHGHRKGRFSEYVPFRMLEVEAAANAVYYWASTELVRRRVSEERPLDGPEYAAAVRQQAQELRRQTHAQLMQAFLPADVFEPPERPALHAV